LGGKLPGQWTRRVLAVAFVPLPTVLGTNKKYREIPVFFIG